MGTRLEQPGSLPRRYDDGTPIVRQGEMRRSLFLVLDGLVRLTSVTRSGRQVVLALLGPGELFGESALLGEPSPFEARPVALATVLAIDARALETVIARQPSTAAEVLRLLAARLRRASTALEDALALDVGGRLSRRLHELATRHGVAGPAGVGLALPMTQEELARMIGASRETVSRNLASLSARGLVRRRGRAVVIPDLEALAAAAEGRARSES